MAISTPNQFPVRLTDEQRERLEDLTRNGHAPAKKIQHARVLLLSDGHRAEGRLSRTDIAQVLGMHVNTVDRIRKRFVLEGEQPAVDRKPRATPPIPPKIDGRAEALLIAICCGPPPEGRARWTLKLLTAELVKRKVVTQVCAETVRKALKKTSFNRGGRSAGAFPNGTTPASSRRWKTSLTSTWQGIPKKSP
jgi:transposase